LDLEERKFDTKELLRILTKVVEQFCSLASKGGHIVGGLIDAVI